MVMIMILMTVNIYMEGRDDEQNNLVRSMDLMQTIDARRAIM